MVRAARTRARKLGREFSITAADIRVPEFCPILGIRLEKRPGAHSGSPSLDRIDSARGYTPDNIQVISLRANQLKRDGTLAEFERLVSYWRYLEAKKQAAA
jgi:hypothetical protein